MGMTSYATHATKRPFVAIEAKDRRRRRRSNVQPMYSSCVVRVLSKARPPIEGHVVDLSETGIAVEVDELIKVGQAVTIEFMVAGLGRLRNHAWQMFAAAAEVTRHDEVEDFPGGPYKTALRFIRLPAILQAQIARYIIAHPRDAKLG